MTDSIQNLQHPCWAEFNCFYKVGNSCTFRQQLEAILPILQEKQHKGFNCVINLADTCPLPCKGLDKKSRQRGIGNVFADAGLIP